MGDGTMAIFGLEYEDHALRACLAAKEIANDIENYVSAKAWSVNVRCGVDCGIIILHQSDEYYRSVFRATGEAVHMAARAEHNSKLNSVCITKRVLDIISDYGQFSPIETDKLKNYTNNTYFYNIDNLIYETFAEDKKKKLLKLYRSEEKRFFRNIVNLNLPGSNFFLMGDAGLGKSFFVHYLKENIKNKSIFYWKFRPAYVPQIKTFKNYLLENFQSLNSEFDFTILEDIHYATEQEKLLIDQIIFNQRKGRLFITSRDVINNQAKFNRLYLKPLTDKQSFVYIEDSLGKTELTPQQIKVIIHKSNGYPLLLKEMCSRVKFNKEGSFIDGVEEILPNMAQIVSLHYKKYNLLSREERSVIDTLAIFGLSMSIHDLVSLNPYLSIHIISKAMHNLEKLDIIRKKVTDSNIYYSFCHEIQRQSIYSFILEKNKKDIHYRIYLYIKGKDIPYKMFYCGFHLMRSGHYKRAYFCFKKSIQEYERNGEYIKCLECISDMQKVLKYTNFRIIHSKEKELNLDLDRARIYLASSDFELFQRTMVSMKENHNFSEIINDNKKYVHLLIAMECRERELSRAREFALQSLNNTNLIEKDKNIEIWLNSQLSEIYIEEGNFGNAVQCINKVRYLIAQRQNPENKMTLLASPLHLSYAFEIKILHLKGIKREDLLTRCLDYIENINDVFTKALIFCLIHESIYEEKGLNKVFSLAKHIHQSCQKNDIKLLIDYCKSIYAYYRNKIYGSNAGLSLIKSVIEKNENNRNWPNNHISLIYIKMMIAMGYKEKASQFINEKINTNFFQQEKFQYKTLINIKESLNEFQKLKNNTDDIILHQEDKIDEMYTSLNEDPHKKIKKKS